ncbi:MAG TPA: HD domain-containing phosphohydrolase [Gaiellaceae bacterium]|nr:HD domain-containing phosphohydrolase [Gaiellaceae bacterium]
MHLLLVDDDPSLRALVRTTFEAVDVDVDEAGDVDSARRAMSRCRPDAIVLDIGMPGTNGLEYLEELKADPATRGIPVVLLTGIEAETEAAANGNRADAFVRKPFSPLELLAIVERLAGGLYGIPFRATKKRAPEEQLLLYARDLRHLLEIERGQRVLLQKAYQETVAALASALETKDTGTRAHSQRVQRYAVELASAIAPDLAQAESAQYGFLLHDVGKIGIPDHILQKPGALTEREESLMRTHTVLGEQMLGGVAFLRGPGLEVVRHHHERWDGGGYPDGLEGAEIPLGARVFAVADALDAMTSDRPYRKARTWEFARVEITDEAGRQFDPDVVEAFRERELALREVAREFAAA